MDNKKANEKHILKNRTRAIGRDVVPAFFFLASFVFKKLLLLLLIKIGVLSKESLIKKEEVDNEQR